MYLTQCLHRMVREAPSRVAAADLVVSYDWCALTDRVARFAGALRGRGLLPLSAAGKVLKNVLREGAAASDA